MRTSNPSLSDNTFRSFGGAFAGSDAMTIEGTVTKTGVLLACVILTAAWSWSRVAAGGGADLGGYLAMGGIGGFILALATIFKPNWSPITAPIYALCEGLLLGGISAVTEARYPGVAMQAVALTFGTLLCLLLAYRLGLVRATEKFRLGVVAATGAICLVYIATMVLSLFHIHAFSSLFGNGMIGIGFSLVVVVIAALNLVLDFDFIERGAAYGAPKFMEWYGAFALMVTLIWLYLEILRLLSKFRSRD
jgi:uncharacterized YccA/Bax inhibitor family protein